MSQVSLFRRLISRYLIDGLSGMALGLFSTLIIGLIIKQIGAGLGGSLGAMLIQIGSIALVTTGAGIGVGVAHKLRAANLIIYASAVTGMFGAYAGKILEGSVLMGGAVHLAGPGEPLGAFIATLVGIEMGRLVFGKTRLDIVITPMVTLISGGLVAIFIGPPIGTFMTYMGDIILFATQQRPLGMGVIISVFMGIFLTLPISSAAISIILGLKGLAAGAATAGCSAQMVGFAVASYRENKINGLLAQGLGTSMLQMPNIVKNPKIWIPAIVASAITGPIATVLFNMENNPSGGGMGTSGMVGQIMTWTTMIGTQSPVILFVKIALIHFIFPAIIAFAVSEWLRRIGWIKSGDMRLEP
ncbi:MAG: PTS sugar transporter subunit IIC [Desulfobacteraceae bacterium 4572_35.2]|nr:MAG: PTS sugar transporter subunit IIC [Desulfobacteraceae bacterium 4572_35.2]